MFFPFWQFVKDLHCLKTHRNHTQEQVEDIPWLTLFLCPVVRIIYNTAGFVGLDLIALHDPFDGGSTIDYVIVGFQGDVGQLDPGGELDDRFIFLVREAHLLHMEIVVFSSFDNHFSTCRLCLIVEVQVCQSSSCLA